MSNISTRMAAVLDSLPDRLTRTQLEAAVASTMRIVIDDSYRAGVERRRQLLSRADGDSASGEPKMSGGTDETSGEGHVSFDDAASGIALALASRIRNAVATGNALLAASTMTLMDAMLSMEVAGLPAMSTLGLPKEVAEAFSDYAPADSPQQSAASAVTAAALRALQQAFLTMTAAVMQAWGPAVAPPKSVQLLMQRWSKRGYTLRHEEKEDVAAAAAVVVEDVSGAGCDPRIPPPPRWRVEQRIRLVRDSASVLSALPPVVAEPFRIELAGVLTPLQQFWRRASGERGPAARKALPSATPLSEADEEAQFATLLDVITRMRAALGRARNAAPTTAAEGGSASPKTSDAQDGASGIMQSAVTVPLPYVTRRECEGDVASDVPPASSTVAPRAFGRDATVCPYAFPPRMSNGRPSQRAPLLDLTSWISEKLLARLPVATPLDEAVHSEANDGVDGATDASAPQQAVAWKKRGRDGVTLF